MPRPAQPDFFARAQGPQDAQGLTISAQSDAALGPEQRKYNQLVAKIDKLRAELQAWDEAVPRFAQDYAQQMRPLQVELASRRRQIALKLRDLLASKDFNKADRSTLARTLCEEAALLSDSEFVDEAAAAELEALHDQYAEAPLKDERREAINDVKAMLEVMSGLDLGDEEFESEEALMRHAQQRVQAAAAAGHQIPSFPFGPHGDSTGPGRQTSAQRKRAQKQAQKQADDEAQASQSVREIFRKLASALHPDRAEDDADRIRRTALMQRVNQAYEQQDLLGLFALQLEIEQIDPEHLARAGIERIRHYNRVLTAQAGDLQHEVDQRVLAFEMEFGIDSQRKLNPRRLKPVLDEDLRGIRAALERVASDLRQLSQPAGVRRWIAQERRQHQFDDDDPFELPF